MKLAAQDRETYGGFAGTASPARTTIPVRPFPRPQTLLDLISELEDTLHKLLDDRPDKPFFSRFIQ